MASLVGQTLNSKYRVISHVGEGSMGTVYLAEHVALKKKIALKVLHSDLQFQGDSLKRFQQEGIAAGRFSHPNAIQIFDFDEVQQEGIYFLAMEFVEGTNLKRLLEQRGPLDISVAVDCTRQILGTLAEAHRQGIIHRDLKPENVMLIPKGDQLDSGTAGGYTVKVLDFGISKLIDLQRGDVLATQTGRILGTPLYMSPEQCMGQQVDERSDLYAVGLILREMLTGKPPFEGANVTEILIKHTSEAIPSVKAVRPDLDMPKDLEVVFKKVLAKDRDDRYASATQMIESLDSIRYDRLARGGLLSKMGTKGMALGLGVIVVSISAFLYFRDGESPSPDQASKKESSAGTQASTRLSARPESELTEIQREYVSLLAQVFTYLDNGQLTQAQTLLDRAFQMSCRDGEFFVCRGWYFFEKGDVESAEQEFLEALELMPEDAEVLSGLGWIALESKEFDNAEARFREALRREEKSVRVFVGMGRTLEGKGNREGAKSQLESAVRFNDQSALARFSLGKYHFTGGNYEAAVTELVAAKRYGRSPEIFEFLGRAYQALGREDESEREWKEALVLDGTLDDIRLELAVLYAKRELYSDAEAQVVSVLGRDGSRVDARMLNASVALKTGQRDRAARVLREVLVRTGYHRDASMLLALIEHRSGELDSAVTLYRQILEKDSADELAQTNLGIALVGQRRFDEARDEFESILLNNPDNLAANLQLGILYMERLSIDAFPNAFEKAAQCFHRYVDSGGDHPDVVQWLLDLEG